MCGHGRHNKPPGTRTSIHAKLGSGGIAVPCRVELAPTKYRLSAFCVGLQGGSCSHSSAWAAVWVPLSWCKQYRLHCPGGWDQELQANITWSSSIILCDFFPRLSKICHFSLCERPNTETHTLFLCWCNVHTFIFFYVLRVLFNLFFCQKFCND